ncbi:MAG: hypothetical protein APR53_09200 [Methanoculleus sp. SDB]|nr:MAG: hypothetical protein APR53_09200 [Methanoculleus sp. SDB]
MICCPVCGSTEMYLVAGGYTGMLYRCKQCGYEGALVVEDDRDTEERGANAQGKNEEDSL